MFLIALSISISNTNTLATATFSYNSSIWTILDILKPSGNCSPVLSVRIIQLQPAFIQSSHNALQLPAIQSAIPILYLPQNKLYYYLYFYSRQRKLAYLPTPHTYTHQFPYYIICFLTYVAPMNLYSC